MADVFSKRKRSDLMSRIRSRNNKATELALAQMLRRNSVTGWRRHVQLPGTPDFVLRASRLAIFVDGCFWHGCPSCGNKSAAQSENAEYWIKKITSNKRRDQLIGRRLRSTGWVVLRIWEHDLKRRPGVCVSRIRKALA